MAPKRATVDRLLWLHRACPSATLDKDAALVGNLLPNVELDDKEREIDCQQEKYGMALRWCDRGLTDLSADRHKQGPGVAPPPTPDSFAARQKSQQKNAPRCRRLPVAGPLRCADVCGPLTFAALNFAAIPRKRPLRSGDGRGVGRGKQRKEGARPGKTGEVCPMSLNSDVTDL